MFATAALCPGCPCQGSTNTPGQAVPSHLISQSQWGAHTCHAIHVGSPESRRSGKAEAPTRGTKDPHRQRQTSANLQGTRRSEQAGPLQMTEGLGGGGAAVTLMDR